tara:strand:- start:328 stop:771 length:444 start_codon:yes stop_codon:yes gene_type:complete
MEEVKSRIKAHEGYRLEPYNCTEGFLTGGWGHKILDGEEVPTTKEGWSDLFDKDFNKALTGANNLIEQHLENTSWIDLEDHKRNIVQGILIEMCFQLGEAGVSKFKKMFKAMSECNFEEASVQMKDSRWRQQTPERCLELSTIIQNL